MWHGPLPTGAGAVSDGPPRIRYTVGLQEAVVDLLLRRRAESGDAQVNEEYRRAADRIYVQYAQHEARLQAFRLLYARLFETLQCGEPVRAVVIELSGLVDEAIVSRGWSQAQEGAELGLDRRTVGIRLRPVRFGDPGGLTRFLRHECGHIGDMLDATFGYGNGLPEAAGPLRLVGEHFGFLWNCSVDGRIARVGREPLRTRAEYEEAGTRVFAGRPGEVVRAVGRLWEGERPTYPMLLQLATDRTAFASFAGVVPIGDLDDLGPLPGGRCPLCGFPTHEWALVIDEPVVERIALDFPQWRRGQSACTRCVEGYALQLIGT